MSLKAKLEAVIYAAEEPVTLAQLAAIFAGEALAWKAEQEEVRAAEAADSAEATLPLDIETAGAAEPSPEPESAEAAAEAVAEETAEPDKSAAEAEAGAPADRSSSAGWEAKRAARQRDREVRAILRQLLDEIAASYSSDERGVEIREIAGGYRMATKPECHDAVRMFVKSLKPPLKLSLPALETLAVIAYKQPVTAPEVNEIRGVDSSGVFGSLLARKLIATAGRKQVIGRPILYKTTREFLLRFGLKDLAELPSMEEFEKMAASELEEMEPAEAAGAESEIDETAGEPLQESAESVEAAEAPEPNSESNSFEAAPVHTESNATNSGAE